MPADVKAALFIGSFMVVWGIVLYVCIVVFP
jgi:hypothetical protein